MGTALTCFIEYERDGDTYSVSDTEGLFAGSKDYAFFTAIAGVRPTSAKPALFTPRGLPEIISPQLSIAIQNEVFNGAHDIGWLTLPEIEQSIEHQNLTTKSLHFESQTLLNIMKDLNNRIGNNSAKLVFAFD